MQIKKLFIGRQFYVLRIRYETKNSVFTLNIVALYMYR